MLSLKLGAGGISEITFQTANRFDLVDCRDSGFVTLRFTDNNGQEIEVYVDSPLLASMFARLASLFAPSLITEKLP